MILRHKVLAIFVVLFWYWAFSGAGTAYYIFLILLPILGYKLQKDIKEISAIEKAGYDSDNKAEALRRTLPYGTAKRVLSVYVVVAIVLAVLEGFYWHSSVVRVTLGAYGTYGIGIKEVSPWVLWVPALLIVGHAAYLLYAVRSGRLLPAVSDGDLGYMSKGEVEQTELIGYARKEFEENDLAKVFFERIIQRANEVNAFEANDRHSSLPVAYLDIVEEEPSFHVHSYFVDSDMLYEATFEVNSIVIDTFKKLRKEAQNGKISDLEAERLSLLRQEIVNDAQKEFTLSAFAKTRKQDGYLILYTNRNQAIEIPMPGTMNMDNLLYFPTPQEYDQNFAEIRRRVIAANSQSNLQW
ncbi:MAG: hypothetical protein LKJ47_05820 [Bifidobacteriaceae bacterium]|jgi:hypothetical protein|nr:hypothetical protein [Bifidobacteriaceae bacterium]